MNVLKINHPRRVESFEGSAVPNFPKDGQDHVRENLREVVRGKIVVLSNHKHLFCINKFSGTQSVDVNSGGQFVGMEIYTLESRLLDTID